MYLFNYRGFFYFSRCQSLEAAKRVGADDQLYGLARVAKDRVVTENLACQLYGS